MLEWLPQGGWMIEDMPQNGCHRGGWMIEKRHKMAATGGMDDHTKSRIAAVGGMDHRKMPQNDHKNARMAASGRMDDRKCLKWVAQGELIIIKMLKCVAGAFDDRNMP